MAKIRAKRSACPIAHALDIFGDRWTLLIIRDLALKDRHRYNEFLHAGEKIATNILANRLARLEAGGIVVKILPDDSTRASYALTQKGIDLVPVIIEMIRWSANHDPNTGCTAAFRKKLVKQSAAVAAGIQQRLRNELSSR